MRRACFFTLSTLLLIAGSAACGDDSTAGGGDPGGGGAGANGGGGDGAGGNGGGAPASLTSAFAPDEFTVVVNFDGTFSNGFPSQSGMYTLTSLVGPIDVVGDPVLDASAGTITLTTEKQKLGVNYTVTVKAPGNELDLKFASFPSADTATFWATDFDDDFSDYQVVARREAVGEHVVIYATVDAEDASDLAETVSIFDEEIFPTETSTLIAAPDRDGNGKVVLLGLDGGNNYGGYFSPVNSLTAEQAEQFGLHSNEMEMLYISVPDLQGNYLPYQVVAHEFSHLLYNEAHDFNEGDWSWHNEGLAECAVHLVTGTQNQYAIDWYYSNQTSLEEGQSLVVWTYSNYDQYAQAYMFWSYLASRLGGAASFGDLFNVSGNPTSMSSFLTSELGLTLTEAQLDFLTALIKDDATGPHGFGGFIELPGPPETLPTAPAQLLPYTGVLMNAQGSDVVVAGAGPDVIFRGVNGAGAIDGSSPFDTQGGLLIALNADDVLNDPSEQSSGVPAATLVAPAAPRALAAQLDRAWLHPPPVKPANMKALRAWRERTRGR